MDWVNKSKLLEKENKKAEESEIYALIFIIRFKDI